MDSEPYWTALVQLLPVLAIAIVVEARFMRSRWRSTTPPLQRLFQSLLWTLGVAACSVGTFSALEVLRSGEEPSAFLDQVAGIAVGVAFGSVVGSPILDLFVAETAPAWTRLLTSDVRSSFRVLGMRRQIRRSQRRVAKMRDGLIELSRVSEAELPSTEIDARIESALARRGDHPEASDEYVRSLRAVSSIRIKSADRLRELFLFEEQARKYWTEALIYVRGQRKTNRLRERARFLDILQQMDPQQLPTHRPWLMRDEEPDDGGFVAHWDQRVPPPNPWGPDFDS